MRVRDTRGIGVLEHPDALQDLVHQRRALVAGLHQILLRRHDHFGRKVIERETDCNQPPSLVQ